MKLNKIKNYAMSVMLLLISSCMDYSSIEEEVESIQLAGEETSQLIELNRHRVDTWNAKSSADWCSVVPSSDNDYSSFILHVSKNPSTTVSRSANIIFVSKWAGRKYHMILLNQLPSKTGN